jgi:hypothetical protein
MSLRRQPANGWLTDCRRITSSRQRLCEKSWPVGVLPLKAALPSNSPDRLSSRYRYGILRTSAYAAPNHTAEIARIFFRVPIASVSLLDRNRIWFKSHHGIHTSQVKRARGFCASTILSVGIYRLCDPNRMEGGLHRPEQRLVRIIPDDTTEKARRSCGLMGNPPRIGPENRQPDATAPLDSILRTEQLRERPQRSPDYEIENRALVSLVRALADHLGRFFKPWPTRFSKYGGLAPRV